MANRRQHNPARSRKKKELLPLTRCGEDVSQTHNSQRPTLLSAIGPHAVFLLVLLFLTGIASPVFAIKFSAYWSYKQAGGDDRETLTEFQQRYSLGVGQALSYRPTHAITASASVGYTRNESNTGKGFFTTDNIGTSAQLSLVNDIFLTQFSGRTDIRMSEANDQSQTAWSATLASNWNIPLFPKLRLSYSEFIEPVTGISLIATGGQKEKNTSASLSWDLILAQLSYQFSHNESEDEIGNSLSSGDSHFARITTEGQFWDRRFLFNFSQQFGYTTQEVAIGEEGGFFELPLEGTTFSKITNPGTPDDLKPDEDDYEDPNSPLPQEVTADERVHFYLDLGIAEQVNILRLSLADSFTVPQALELAWELYTRSDQFDQWQLALDDLQGINTTNDENSIDINVDITAEQIILVAKNVPSGPLTFTALSAFTLVTESFSSTNTNYLTNFGVGYRITRNLRASANLTLEENETDSGDFVVESSRRTVSGNLRWSPHPAVSPALSFSEYRDDSTLGPENINRTYSLIISTIPMDTLNVSFLATHVERYSDALKYFDSNRYSMVTKAQIYPDLTATWNLSQLISEELSQDDLVINRTRTSNNVRLRAFLTRGLTADLSTTYSHDKSDFGTTEFGDATFGLQYRPSTILSARGNYTTYFLGSDRSDILDLNLDLLVVNTYKTRLSFRSNFRQTDKTSQSFGLVGSWDISKYFSLVALANYRIADVHIYNFRINLSLAL